MYQMHYTARVLADVFDALRNRNSSRAELLATDYLRLCVCVCDGLR